MGLIEIVLILVVIGVLLYFVNAAPFIDGNIKWLIMAVVIIVTLIWLLQTFGLIGPIGNVRIR